MHSLCLIFISDDDIPVRAQSQSHGWNWSKQKRCNRFVWKHSGLFWVTQPQFKTQRMIQLHKTVYWTAANPLIGQGAAGCKQNDLTIKLPGRESVNDLWRHLTSTVIWIHVVHLQSLSLSVDVDSEVTVAICFYHFVFLYLDCVVPTKINLI